MAPKSRKPAGTSRSSRTIGGRGNEEEEGIANPTPITIEGGGKGKRKRQTSNPNPNTVPARMTRSSSRIGVVEEERNRQMPPRGVKAAVTSNRNPNPVPRSPSPRPRSPDPDFERYNFGYLYEDIQCMFPDKETILRDCEAKLQTSRDKAQKKLETLVSFLRRKGIGTGRGKTSQETYEEALKLFIEGNLEGKLKKDVARQMHQYLGMRVINASMILIDISHIYSHEYDARVAGLIVKTLEDLKDIKLTAPELDALESLARVYLNVPQEAQAVMGRAVLDLVNKWTLNSRAQYEMMRVWAESPTWVIDTGRHNHLVSNPY